MGLGSLSFFSPLSPLSPLGRVTPVQRAISVIPEARLRWAGGQADPWRRRVLRAPDNGWLLISSSRRGPMPSPCETCRTGSDNSLIRRDEKICPIHRITGSPSHHGCTYDREEHASRRAGSKQEIMSGNDKRSWMAVRVMTCIDWLHHEKKRLTCGCSPRRIIRYAREAFFSTFNQNS